MNDAAVIEIVQKTRETLLPHWGNVAARDKHGSDGISTVTDLDLSTEKYLQSELAKIDGSIDFAGEEFGGSREHDRFWLCDPIDGTVHFVRGLPFCTTMLALIEEGRVNFAIIYDFVNDRLYHARRGEGAFVNGTPIHVSERPFDSAYLSFEAKFEKPENAAMRQKIRERVNLIEIVTSGYEFALVAAGKIEGRVCYDPYAFDYDVAPGSLLIEEAGGVVANVGKSTYDYRDVNIIAANPSVYHALTEGPEALFPISRS